MDGTYKSSGMSTWFVDAPANEDIDAASKINIIQLDEARELMQNLARIRDPHKLERLLRLFKSKRG
ncbi:MAG: hypothetical protein H6907_07100 [Hyphomicrobiales bacterium]|nr:hypothetical protein [Hyphomicrobiales bacterium]